MKPLNLLGNTLFEDYWETLGTKTDPFRPWGLLLQRAESLMPLNGMTIIAKTIVYGRTPSSTSLMSLLRVWNPSVNDYYWLKIYKPYYNNGRAFSNEEAIDY